MVITRCIRHNQNKFCFCSHLLSNSAFPYGSVTLWALSQAPFGRRVGIIQASLASAHHWLHNSRYASPRVETLTFAIQDSKNVACSLNYQKNLLNLYFFITNTFILTL